MSAAGERLLRAAAEVQAMAPPRGPITVGKIGDVTRILDRNGNDIMTMSNGPERIAECLNALSGVWFPQNHVSATEDYVKRLETLLHSPAPSQGELA